MSETGNNGRLLPQALSNELERYCQSELLSEEGLREIIERHGLTPNNDNALIDNNYFFFRACRNERITEGIIRLLLEYFPAAANATTDNGITPLHYACINKNMTRGIIQLLIDAAPDSLRSVDNEGYTNLHMLCANNRMNEAASIQLLELLIEKYPEAVRHADNRGGLPTHIAAQRQSPKLKTVV